MNIKRKVQRSGKSSMSVIIPSIWAKENGLRPGSEVEIELAGNRMVISTNLHPALRPGPDSHLGPPLSELDVGWCSLVEAATPLDAYKKHCHMLRQPPLTKTLRKKLVSAAKRERGRDWDAYFLQVSKSSFLTGKVKDWSATLLWLLGPENMAKVDSGSYDDHKKVSLVAHREVDYNDLGL